MSRSSQALPGSLLSQVCVAPRTTGLAVAGDAVILKDSVNPRRGSMNRRGGWVPGYAQEAPACPAPAKHCRGLSHLRFR